MKRFHVWVCDSPALTVRQFLLAFAILFALVTVALVGEGLLARANRHRIVEQQQSRVESCKSTYRSIEQAALFFFPPPKLRTPMQRRVAHDLHVWTLGKVKSCRAQTAVARPR